MASKRRGGLGLGGALLISLGAGILGIAIIALLGTLMLGARIWGLLSTNELLVVLSVAFLLPFLVTFRFVVMMVYQQAKE